MAPKAKIAQSIENTPDQISVNKAEFIRTRDALVTSWMQLNGAIEGAIKAYITHSNHVLEGTEALNHESLNILSNISLHVAQAGQRIKDEDVADEKPKRKPRTVKPKDPNAPKRPLTAYLLYLEEMRPVIQQDLGEGQKRGDISAEGTRRWHLLTSAQQQVYKDRYQAAYAKYQDEMKDYLASADAMDVDADVAETPAAAEDSSDSSDDSDDEAPVPVKEKTPVPLPSSTKTPKSKSKKLKAEPEAPASSPIKSSKKSKAAAAVDAEKDSSSPALKRKSEAKADVSKPKKTKKEAVVTPKADVEEEPKKEKRERKKRKSEAAA